MLEVNCNRGPAVYLDQFALHHFATHEEHRKRFLGVFAHRGELLFSSANLSEVVLTSGVSLTRVTEFLDAIGPFWVPIEIDVWAVIREMGSRAPGEPHPALDGEMLRIIYDHSPGVPTEIRLGSAIRAFRDKGDESGEVYRSAMRAAKVRAAERVAQLRAECRLDPEKAPIVVTTLGRPVHIATALMRAILVDEARSFAWTANDAVDIAHALTPLTVADALFMDRAWKQRVHRIAAMLPADIPPVYYRPEVDAFSIGLKATLRGARVSDRVSNAVRRGMALQSSDRFVRL
jgi:hypothetical protein